MEVDTLIEPLHAVMLQVGAFLPRLAIALVALIAGWLLAKAARFAVVPAAARPCAQRARSMRPSSFTACTLSVAPECSLMQRPERDSGTRW